MERKNRKIENCKENEKMSGQDCVRFERKTPGKKQEIEERNKMLNVTPFFFHINSSEFRQNTTYTLKLLSTV